MPVSPVKAAQKQDKAPKQDKTRHGNTWLGKARHGKPGQDKTRQNQTRQDKARTSKIESQQNKTRLD